MHSQPQPTLIQYFLPLVIIAIVLFFRLRSTGKARPLRLERLWIVPTLYLALTVLLFSEMTPHGLGWLWAALSLAAGAAIGWQRGRAMHISVDPETHALNQTPSPLAMLLLIGLIVVRYTLRAAADAGAASWHLDAVLITDCLVAFALGLLSVQRLEMFLRGSRLLAETRAGRSV
jgi:hypothetical protein